MFAFPATSRPHSVDYTSVHTARDSSAYLKSIIVLRTTSSMLSDQYWQYIAQVGYLARAAPSILSAYAYYYTLFMSIPVSLCSKSTLCTAHAHVTFMVHEICSLCLLLDAAGYGSKCAGAWPWAVKNVATTSILSIAKCP